MAINNYIIMFVLYLLVMLGVSIYVYRLRKTADEMHGMMAGMTLGMLAGLVTATLILIPTGNFLYGVMIGSVVGLLFGIPFGTLGGHLGIMEGVIAGPMGGMMGAMLGQMIRPFDIDVFMPFLTTIFLLTAAGITYAMQCRANCCAPEHTTSHNARKPSRRFVILWLLVAVVVLTASVVLHFSVDATTTFATKTIATTTAAEQELQLPGYLQETLREERAEATLKEGYQEVDLHISASRYSPNVIVARKDVPLRIRLSADENAGCAREIVFPDFGVSAIVPAGGNETIEFTPTEEGEFLFRCSMDMVRGKLIVT